MPYLDDAHATKKSYLYDTDKHRRFRFRQMRYLIRTRLTPHMHKVSETYIITEGTGEVYNNDHWEPVKKGDIRLFDAGIWHCCRTLDPNGIKLVYFFNTGPFSDIEYIYPSMPKL